ncbi:MAG TPA: phosphoribosyltransferase [Opitutus sp.]|nr:phosphoribosyltransferase [Opitutus sp.]
MANAIDDMTALRRAAFWLQEELARCGAVLVDTWGMVPVVMEVMRLIGRFVPYDALRAHSLAAQQESIKQVTKLFQLCPADQSVLFLQSIRGAGHLVAEIKREVSAADLPPERLRCVNLYGFAPEPGDTTPTFSVLPSVGQYYRSEQQCKMCQEGQEFIRIDPKLYYIVSATEKPVTLTPGFWSPARAFFDRYHAVEGVFRLHADHPYDARHHAFYIDAGVLSTSPLFRERLMEKASQPKPDLVVSPGHEAGLKLAGCVGRETGVPIITSEGLRRNTLSADDLDRFLRAKNILILDDVTITGTRITDYLCAIREDYAPAEIAGKNVAFLLAVARPPSQEQWVAIQRSCSNHDSFSITCDCVEFLALPNWPQAHCPWCHEFDLLQNISARFARPPSWLLARIGALANKRQGLQSSPFWLTAGTTEPVLGFAAKAGPARMQAIPTLFATASALQRFRHATDPTKALAPGFPISRVLDFPRCFKNYSEGLIRAALLRALRPDEFPASNRKQIRDHALGLIGKHPPGLLLGEVILTTARGGLSLPTRTNWDQLLAVHGTDFTQHFAAVVGVRD